MEYFKFKNPNIGNQISKKNILYKILNFFLPQANPDFNDEYDRVILWYIEYDDIKKYINREIGINENGEISVVAPYKGNLGFWIDSDLNIEDFEKFDLEQISKSDFDYLWEMFFSIAANNEQR